MGKYVSRGVEELRQIYRGFDWLLTSTYEMRVKDSPLEMGYLTS